MAKIHQWTNHTKLGYLNDELKNIAYTNGGENLDFDGLLYLDYTNGKVGIKTDTVEATSLLHLQADDDEQAFLNIESTATANGANENAGFRLVNQNQTWIFFNNQQGKFQVNLVGGGQKMIIDPSDSDRVTFAGAVSSTGSGISDLSGPLDVDGYVLERARKVFLYGMELEVTSGTANTNKLNTTHLLGLPDSATTEVVHWFECPQGWRGRTIEMIVHYRGVFGVDAYRIQSTINSRGVGDLMSRNGSIDTDLLPQGGTTNVITNHTISTTHSVVSDAEMLFVELSRTGSHAEDSASNDFDLLGITLQLA